MIRIIRFKDTATMFDYLEDLGVTTLYMLPFADSPMADAGFDVKKPREKLEKILAAWLNLKNLHKRRKKRF